MNKFIVLCKEKDKNTITMYSGMTYTQAERKLKEVKKDGAMNIQLRMVTKGASSVLVGNNG